MKDESKFNNHTDSMTEMISEQYELDIKNKRLIEENDQLTSMVDELQARLEAQRTYRAMLALKIGTPLTVDSRVFAAGGGWGGLIRQLIRINNWQSRKWEC